MSRAGYFRTGLGAGLAVLAFVTTAPAEASRLNQIPGPGGCIVAVVIPGCTTAAVGSPSAIVVRGEHAYVASSSDNQIRIYDRDPVSGALTPRPVGLAGCIAEDGPGTTCVDAHALVGPVQMALSADGTDLYVVSAGSQGVAVLTRDPTTGNLSHPAGVDTCVTRSGTAGACGIAPSISRPFSLAISPDGADVYVAGFRAGGDPDNGGGFVTALDVLVGGGLIQHVGGGCFENTPTAGPACGDARAMNNARVVRVSPDGGHVYVSSSVSNAVTVFTRGAGGGLSHDPGPDGCLQKTGGGEGCRETDLLGTEVLALAFTNAATAYVGSLASGAITLVARNPATGGLTTPGPCAVSGAAGPFASCANVSQNLFGIGDFEPTQEGELIVGARFGRGLNAFTLGAGGAPLPVPPPLGCLATGGIGGITPCTVPRGFARTFGEDFGPTDVALSGDGKFVYGVSPPSDEDRAGIVVAKRDTADPACADATVAVSPGQELALPLTCTDGDGDEVTLAVLSVPEQGTTGAVDQASRTVSYTAPTGFTGTQTLTFKGTALGIDSAPATITINIAPPATDTTAPKLTLSGKKTQKLDAAIEVGAGCDEACTARAAGTLTVTTPGGGKSSLAKRRFKIRSAAVAVAAGGKTTLRLKVKGKVRKAAEKALKAGGRASARITVTATDAAGNAATAKRTVKLKAR